MFPLNLPYLFFFYLHLTSRQANHLLFMSSYHHQTNAHFPCRASAYPHLIKLSPFLASGWMKELFGRQQLIDRHHDWRQHGRCFNRRPALVLWRWMCTYQELCCSCQARTDRWRLWREMHGDEFVEPVRRQLQTVSFNWPNKCRCNDVLK